jgi:hemerythrin superfamily protein
VHQRPARRGNRRATEEISMADDKTRRGTPDSKRLNMSEKYEVAYAKSTRASPARKAMLKKAEASKAAGNGAAAKRGTGASAKRSTGASAKRSSGASAKRSTGASAKRAAAGASRKTAAKGTSTRATSSKARSGAGSKSASPAMKRTNASPVRARAAKPSVRGTPTPPRDEKTAENTAPRTMKTADAVDLLTDDHLAVSALFKKYEKLAKKQAPADERQALVQQICAMLKAHTAIEEEIFYPAARKAGIDADLLDEADVEHASAKDLIAQLEASGPDSDRYDAKVTVLGEYITHHVVEEHTEMFTKCRRAGMDLVALREAMETRKMELTTGLGAAPEPAGSESPGLLARIGDSLFSGTAKA